MSADQFLDRRIERVGELGQGAGQQAQPAGFVVRQGLLGDAKLFNDGQIHEGYTVHIRYEDNLELSAQRALTVTRALITSGMPRSRVFAAAFGAEQPVASNADEQGRALNRRVEMAPVPRASAAAGDVGTQAPRP